jgi:hypothetical protein
MANIYDVGQLVRLSVVFTVNSVEQSPTALTLEITDPSGDTITKDEGEVVEDDTGDFHYDHGPVTEEGKWTYQWSGTAGVIAAATGHFWVREDLAG